MKRLKLSIYFVSVLMASNILASIEGDLEREDRLRQQVEDVLFDGEPIDIIANDREFLAVLTEPDESRGTVIILHGRGFHADWPDAINPLRTGLVEHGWTTLSLQMPVLPKAARYYDYVPLFDAGSERLNAALNYLKQERSETNIVVLAHSCGAHMAMHRVRKEGSEDFKAYVGLGMGATDYRQYMDRPFPLDQMRIPVLDIYGSEDYPAVIKMAPDRVAMIKQAGNALSRQVVLEGSDHYFANSGEELVTTVANWLDTLP